MLVGPDGAGKTTLAPLLARHWPEPAAYLYMGDNPDCRSAPLPTTRALTARRRWRNTLHHGPPAVLPPGRRGRLGWRAADLVGALVVLTVQVAEEANQFLRLRHRLRRGLLVLVDRYFPLDYHAHTAPAADVGLVPRLHGMWLRRAFPEPDLAVCLDAPAEVLAARKHEGDGRFIERRRQEYLALATQRPGFELVDANRPLGEVERDVAERIAALGGYRAPAGVA